MFYRGHILIIICGIHFTASAQQFQNNSPDELILQKALDAFSLASENNDSALLLAREALFQSQHSENKQAEAHALNSLGWVLLHKGDLDSSVLVFKESHRLFKRFRDPENIAKVDINLSEALTRQSKTADALTYLFEADSIANIQKYENLLTDIKRQLGIVYRESGDKETATRYFKDAIRGFEMQKDSFRLVNTSVSLAILYRDMKSYDSSLALLENCLSLINEPNGNMYQKGMVYENIGETYFSMGNFPEALKNFETSYAIFKMLDTKGNIAYEAYCLGKTLSRLSRFQPAEVYLLEAYHISDTLGLSNYLISISGELSGLYKKAGKWQQAYFFLNRHDMLSDSLDLIDQMVKASELKEKYEGEKKENQIAILESKNQVIKWWFISGVLLTLMIVSIIWTNNYRRKAKEEKVLNYFATSLYNRNSVEDVFWDIAKNCVSKFHLEDCVIYGYDESRKVLVQKAAFGPKNPKEHQINNYLEIPLGRGIVGSVAQTLIPQIVNDVSRDKRYITDDKLRKSEITVPITVEGKLIGIIDSENSRKGFYTKRHMRIFKRIADISSKKITRSLVENELRTKIARDLHDDIGSALTGIHITSKVALQKEVQGADVTDYLETIHRQSGSMLESMGDIIWAIKPENNNLESTIAHMREFASELCEPLGINLRLNIADSLYTTLLAADLNKNLFLIFKEAINNAVKYSKCTIITTEFSRLDNHQISMIITDNGIGFDKRKVKTGNGLINMQDRAKQINGKLLIKDANPGTRVELVFEI